MCGPHEAFSALTMMMPKISFEMLAELPDECKQGVWRFLDATELCRLRCVARDLDQGARVGDVWKQRTVALIKREQPRLHDQRRACPLGLQRQLASRNLRHVDNRTAMLIDTSGSELADAAGEALVGVGTAEDSMVWSHWYRDVFTSVRAFDRANTAFESTRMEIQELKRERSELKDLLQVVQSKQKGDKHTRRVQMHCIRWMNRTHRRQTATKNLRTAQTAALSKAEIQDELQMLESTIQVQTKQMFSMRSQYQKSCHRMINVLTRAVQMLQDMR